MNPALAACLLPLVGQAAPPRPGARESVHWTARFASALVLAAVPPGLLPGAASGGPEQTALPAALESFLTDEAHGGASDREALLAGQPVIRLLDADPTSEVAAFGAVWVNAPAVLHVRELRQRESLPGRGPLTALLGRGWDQAPRLLGLDNAWIGLARIPEDP
ncbi:MAG TPA: hypothetical protein VM778_02315 [Gemmatimonadota bacterium]|nr:hypothetical protein [Gemmatimonadota bacterium]